MLIAAFDCYEFSDSVCDKENVGIKSTTLILPTVAAIRISYILMAILSLWEIRQTDLEHKN